MINALTTQFVTNANGRTPPRSAAAALPGRAHAGAFIRRGR